MTPPPVPLKNRKLAALLAFLVPGLGHAYQGRWGKAVLYFVCIYGLFFGGMALCDWKVLYWRWVDPLSNPESFCYWYFFQFFTGAAALPALIQSTLQLKGFGPILGGYGAEPSAVDLNGLYRLGKIVEIGYIYTQAAGLLNILAIFDAYEGPGAVIEPPEAAPKPEAPAPPAPAAAAAPVPPVETPAAPRIEAAP